MATTAYETIYARVPLPVKKKIEDFKEKNGYPSNAQAIAAMVSMVSAIELLKELLIYARSNSNTKSDEISKKLDKVIELMKINTNEP